MELQALEERVSYCNTKIVELISDNSIPAPLAKFRIRYWEYQANVADRKITAIYNAIKILKKEEALLGGLRAIPEVHGRRDEAMEDWE